MDIKLIPIGRGQTFTFPALPEKLKGKYGARYQSFDIISQGNVKVPKGTDVAEFSWDGVFFGASKRNEPIVRVNHWRDPCECVNLIKEYITNETILNLIVTETWINVDVTVSSFTATPVGAYGNIEYSISFAQKKPLQIYTTKELQIATFVKKTRPRNDSMGSGAVSAGGGTYTVKEGDTLSEIAARLCGGTSKWTDLYNANSSLIESTAKGRNFSNSDHGHWIFPGTTLTLI